MAMGQNVNGIKATKVSPSFLHANSTSHTWIFSAIAELIDNAYDPDVRATQLWIDKREIGKQTCLTFLDNGSGMDADKLHKMLSFGFCEKVEIRGHKPIGHYGNGFKSGSMRLGKDALVLTRCRTSTSIGLLSQSYLKTIRVETVIVPIVTWSLPGMTRIGGDESRNNLRAILTYSLFHNENTLLEELRTLGALRTGTKIIIYNLNRDNNGRLELDFLSDPVDIRNPETHMIDLTTINRPMKEYSPEYQKSLREYCSILFLKPRMKILLRGRKVKTKLISKSLSQTEKDVYKPHWLGKAVPIIFGFTSSRHPDDYGMMLYNRNRLIKAYEKIGYQRQLNDLGVGVVGVVEVDFLEPIHNKQDFNKSDRFNAFITAVSQKLNEYWNEKRNAGPIRQPLGGSRPDWIWCQCDNPDCLKWRRLPPGVKLSDLPDIWFCHMNADASHNRCDIKQEPEDEDEALQRPTYEKTFKKTQEERKRLARIEEMRKLMARERELQSKEAEVERRRKQLNSAEVTKVSSSQENGRSVVPSNLTSEVEQLKAKQEEAEAQKVKIAEIQKKKRDLDRKMREHRQSLIQESEALDIAQKESADILAGDVPRTPDGKTLSDVPRTPGSSTSHVSSTSGVKRKASGDMTPEIRKVFIKTENGVCVTEVAVDGFDEFVNMDNTKATQTDENITSEIDEVCKRIKQEVIADDLIDLITDDEDESPKPPANVGLADVKPDVKELERQLQQQASTSRQQHQGCQTMAVKIRPVNANPAETDGELKELQANVFKLLKFIIPEINIDDRNNVNQLLVEVIEANKNSEGVS